MTTPASTTIQFQTTAYRLKDWLIVALPRDDSAKLPSRGQVYVAGKLNGHDFMVVLEPDGRGGHWMRVSDELQKASGIAAGDEANVELIVRNKEWPEPELPSDFAKALHVAPDAARQKWHDITPMARWEWVRWIGATHSDETRAVRVEKSIAKLAGKHRRPCCFNLAACTEPYVMKGSQLIEP